MKLTMRFLQDAQKEMLAKVREFEPNGAFEAAGKVGLILTHQRAMIRTHKVSGSLRAGHRAEYERPRKGAGFRGVVHLDPSARNYRNGALVSVYGVVEHHRGGEHAFYQQVEDKDSLSIQRAMSREFYRGFKNARGS